jgi:hypothetical protein
MPYGKLIMDSGSNVLFEIEGPVQGEISREGIATGLQRKFEDIMAVIKDTAESAHSGLQKIDAAARPNEYELKFGLKLTAGADVLFARAGSEGSFEVTLRWR